MLGNLFAELAPICEQCGELQEDDLVIVGYSATTGRLAKVKLTDYGFEFYGDIAEITRIREMRCLLIGG